MPAAGDHLVMSTAPSTNYLRTRKWLKMAVKDVERSLRSYLQEDYADSAFRAQFPAEKLCKSMIFLLGFQFKKTHTPAQIIAKEALRERTTKMSSDVNRILSDFTRTARYLEEQGIAARYGLEVAGTLVTPEEFFSRDRAMELLKRLTSLLDVFLEAVSALKTPSEKEIPELAEAREKLQELKRHAVLS